MWESALFAAVEVADVPVPTDPTPPILGWGEAERGAVRPVVDEWGAVAVVASRPVPLLAEAVVLVAGASAASVATFALAALDFGEFEMSEQGSGRGPGPVLWRVDPIAEEES